MLIDIRSAGQGTARQFRGKADLSGLRLWGQTPFPEPVTIEGNLTLRHGRVVLDYKVYYTLCVTCARCLAEIYSDKCMYGTAHQVSEDPDDGERDDVIYAPGGMLDMAQLVREDLLLLYYRPFFCKLDCKGLCPQCGTDLNASQCGCSEQKEVDSRFAALLDLIDE